MTRTVTGPSRWNAIYPRAAQHPCVHLILILILPSLLELGAICSLLDISTAI